MNIKYYLVSTTLVNIFTIFGVFIIGLGFYYFSFDGYYLDDFIYLKYAKEILNNEFQLSKDNLCHRFGLIIPIAFFYKVFSINTFSSNFFTLFCWICSNCLILKILKTNLFTSSIAIILCGLDYYHLTYINKACSDIPVAFFSLLSLFLIHRQYFCINKNHFINAFGFSVSLFLAFISKTSATYLFPFYLMLFIYDFKNNLNFLFWIIVIVSLVFIFSIYFVFYYIQTQDPFYVFTCMDSTQYNSTLSYSNKGFWIMFSRLTYMPLTMFIQSGMIIGLALGLLSIDNSRLKLNNSSFWFWASISIIISFWFGSMSFTFYQPMSLNPRMIILLAPPLSILASLQIESMLTNKKKLLLMGSFFLIISIFCFLFIIKQKSIIYLLISFLFFFIFFIRNTNFKKNIFSLTFLFIFSIQPINAMLKEKIYFYEEEKNCVEKHLFPLKKSKILLVSDYCVSNRMEFYLKFNLPTSWKIIYFDEIVQLKNLNNLEIYVLVNPGFFDHLKERTNLNPLYLTKLNNNSRHVMLYKYSYPFNK